jgi:hypothetical protein
LLYYTVVKSWCLLCYGTKPEYYYRNFIRNIFSMPGSFPTCDMGLMTRYLLLFDSYGLIFLGGRPLWREDGSVIYTCCWPLPAQSFSGPSLLGLATIFYCLRFETSLFVASYDSQGHGGGIRPRLKQVWPRKENTAPLLLHGADHTENTCHVSDC